MTTATLPRRIIRPIATRPARRSMLFGLVATLATGLLVLLATSTAIGVVTGPSVLGSVNVGGIALEGLDRSAAAQRLTAELPALDTGRAVVSAGETRIAVPYADLGRRYEIDAMVDAAFGVGRSGNPIADGIDRLRSLLHPTILPVVVHAYDADALAAISGDIAAEVSHPPREAAVLRDGARFTVRDSAAGLGLAAADVASALAAAVDNPDPADVRIRLAATTLPPVVDTATAERAAEAARAMAADLNQAPVNAQIAVAAGGGLGGVIPGQDGRRLNAAESSERVLDALARRAGGASVGSAALVVNVTE